jgi:myo-inositol-1(or 4)-monophosphatase
MQRLESILAAGLDRLQVSTKEGAFDLVTDADRSTEAWLWERVHAAFPEDGFLGEEYGWRLGPTAGRDWVVDPIDGTANFLSGIPWACSSIAVLSSGSACSGLIVDPFRREVYLTVSASHGSELDGKRVRVAPGEDLAGKVVLLEVPSGKPLAALAPVDQLVVSAGGTARAMGSGALAMALVAAGRAQAIVHAGPKIWDVAAGVALVENAGGVVLGGDGPYVLGGDGPLVAGNASVCRVLQGALHTR